MTYADDDFQPEPDMLHEVVNEDGTVVYESFDFHEADVYMRDLKKSYDGTNFIVKSTPV